MRENSYLKKKEERKKVEHKKCCLFFCFVFVYFLLSKKGVGRAICVLDTSATNIFLIRAGATKLSSVSLAGGNEQREEREKNL